MEDNFKWIPFDIESDIRDIQVRFLLKFDYREFLVSRPNYKDGTYVKRNKEINSTDTSISLRYDISRRYEFDGYQWKLDLILDNPVFGEKKIDVEIFFDKEGEWVKVHEFKKNIEYNVSDIPSYNLKGDSTEQLMEFAKNIADHIFENETGVPSIIDYAILYSKNV